MTKGGRVANNASSQKCDFRAATAEDQLPKENKQPEQDTRPPSERHRAPGVFASADQLRSFRLRSAARKCSSHSELKTAMSIKLRKVVAELGQPAMNDFLTGLKVGL
eukprot:1546006-Alexandrium_andersonii.AAC.2